MLPFKRCPSVSESSDFLCAQVIFCAHVLWALMHRLLSIRPYVCLSTLPKDTFMGCMVIIWVLVLCEQTCQLRE